MGIIYFIISLFATTIGAIAGIGGGVIIKPCLDAMGEYSVSNIGMLSSITVLTMSIVSTIRYVKYGIKIEKKIIVLSVGAVLGGILGKYVFEVFSNTVSDSIAKSVQAIILIILLIFVIFRKYYPQYKTENVFIIAFAGLFMGAISSFLGIGGGPINIIIICTIFAISSKDAAVYSIFVILFSQISTVTSSAINPGLHTYNLQMLVYMLPASVIGGFIGSYLNRKLSKKQVDFLFNAVLVLLIALNSFNIYTALK